MSQRDCDAGVSREDLAAWAIDGVRHPDVDLDRHVERCGACQGALTSLARMHHTSRALRDDPATASRDVASRALARIRVEAVAMRTVQAYAGVVGRAARAAPDYLSLAGSEPEPEEH